MVSFLLEVSSLVCFFFFFCGFLLFDRGYFRGGLRNPVSNLSSLGTMVVKNNRLLNLFFPYLLKDVLDILLNNFLDDQTQYAVKLLQFLLDIDYY